MSRRNPRSTGYPKGAFTHFTGGAEQVGDTENGHVLGFWLALVRRYPLGHPQAGQDHRRALGREQPQVEVVAP